MKKPLKALLLNAFAFPGSGHFLYRCPTSGTFFALSFIVPLIIVLSNIMTQANELALQIQNGSIPLDATELTASITQLVTTKIHTLDIYTYMMLAAWLLSIIDIYRISRKVKHNKAS